MRLRTAIIIAQRIFVYYSIRTSLSANVKRLCISSRLVLQRRACAFFTRPPTEEKSTK